MGAGPPAFRRLSVVRFGGRWWLTDFGVLLAAGAARYYMSNVFRISKVRSLSRYFSV